MSKVPNISTLPSPISKKKIIIVSAVAIAAVVTTVVLRSRLSAEVVETLTETA